MITEDLLVFIKEQLASGKTQDQIRGMLIAGGNWKPSDVDEAFSSIQNIPQPKKSTSAFRGSLVFVLVVVILIIISSFFEGGANITGLFSKPGSIGATIIGFGALFVSAYASRKRSIILRQEKDKKNTSFILDFFKTISYAWIVAPLFIDAGSMGGITAPVPGVFFVIPILGQLAAFSTFITHPVLLVSTLIVFTLYLVSMIRFSRKITQSAVFRILFIIATYIPYWFISKIALRLILQVY